MVLVTTVYGLLGRVRYTILKRGRSTARTEPEIILARMDTGATCHDFVSQATADALIARGAKVEPMNGRVCSAFQGEERLLQSRLICKYGFYNHLTRTVQRIKISPVILPALRAPLIIGLQTMCATSQLIEYYQWLHDS